MKMTFKLLFVLFTFLYIVTLTNTVVNSSPIYPKFIQIKNPDQVASDSGGGDNGEFLRRNQPQEHIIVPLINSLEAEYSLVPDIKKYRKKLTEPDKGVKYKMKINKELNNEVKKLLSNQ